jgi:transketolase
MGMADIAEVLWNDFLKHNPQNPDWYDRDRFISPTVTRRCCSTACCT